ncbi:MAG: putative rane protein [Firmicutes bacterium]|nr:putative rane protein [Bacillota bacterium]
MAGVGILTVLLFATVLSIIEVPKMLQGKLYKELWTFSILTTLGTVLAILKILDISIPNPSDWIAWVYSPVKDFMKSLLK